jgi:hypothetical protein
MTITYIACAKVDLVTLPGREVTQLTIYNSADLTLVRDGRSLTLKEGANRLQFSWANTLIDPTSLSMLPRASAGAIEIQELVFPPRVQNVGIWNIRSEVSGKVPVEISYLTSGLSWKAFYMGTLSEDEQTMTLEGYVAVTNNSGEDYENAQTRLIVGKVNLLDEIAALAQRPYPYGRPGEVPPRPMVPATGFPQRQFKGAMMEMVARDAAAPKQIQKEGLSEYFLYTIEGTETIPNGWSKRLSSFSADGVPVVSLYKFEEEMYGAGVVRYLSFANDTEHKLGDTPIPGGTLKVYRTVGDEQHLAYEGQSSFKYIPVGEDVELNLGGVADVIVEPKLMETKTDNYRFDKDGNVNGWDEIKTFRIEAKNTRATAIKLEIKRNTGTRFWDVQNAKSDRAQFEKVDLDTIRCTLTMEPRSQKAIEYVLTTYHGAREDDWSRRNR